MKSKRDFFCKVPSKESNFVWYLSASSELAEVLFLESACVSADVCIEPGEEEFAFDFTEKIQTKLSEDKEKLTQLIFPQSNSK